MQLEDRYRSLRESLVTLTDVLLHSRNDDELSDAFRVCGQIAISLFRDETRKFPAVHQGLIFSGHNGVSCPEDDLQAVDSGGLSGFLYAIPISR